MPNSTYDSRLKWPACGRTRRRWSRSGTAKSRCSAVWEAFCGRCTQVHFGVKTISRWCTFEWMYFRGDVPSRECEPLEFVSIGHSTSLTGTLLRPITRCTLHTRRPGSGSAVAVGQMTNRFMNIHRVILLRAPNWSSKYIIRWCSRSEFRWRVTVRVRIRVPDKSPG